MKLSTPCTMEKLIITKLRSIVMLFVLLICTFAVHAQTHLIAADPANNIYPLTFTNLGQDQIVAPLPLGHLTSCADAYRTCGGRLTDKRAITTPSILQHLLELVRGA